jgi:TetR/AcrR family transcriptional regulator
MSTVTQLKRERAADVARQAILDAAEEAFAEHGFAGARIDAIATASGYNKSMIFHYFGDKLGLYLAVFKRTDEQGLQVQAEAFRPLLTDETLTSDARQFRIFLEIAIRTILDLLVEHPRLARIYAWEEATGWQTLEKLSSSQFDTSDVEQFQALLTKAQQAGLIRSSLDPAIILNIIYDLCLSSQTALPRYRMTMKERDFSSPEALMRARAQLVDFIVHGIMVDPPSTMPETRDQR